MTIFIEIHCDSECYQDFWLFRGFYLLEIHLYESFEMEFLNSRKYFLDTLLEMKGLNHLHDPCNNIDRINLLNYQCSRAQHLRSTFFARFNYNENEKIN